MNLDDPAVYETLDPTQMWRTYDSFADMVRTRGAEAVPDLTDYHWIGRPPIPLDNEFPHAYDILIAQTADITISSPATNNPAKRIAGQLIERLPVINSVGFTENGPPIAVHWKRQLNMVGKNFAHTQALDTYLHGGLDGLFFPQALASRTVALILSLPAVETDIHKTYIEAARELYMHMGIAVDIISGRGDNELAQALALIQLGDYVAYYVAIANGVDPALRPATDEFQARLTHPPGS